MRTADIFFAAAVLLAVLSLVCIIAAAVMFFKYNIPRTFGKITGFSAKSAVRKIQKEKKKFIKEQEEESKIESVRRYKEAIDKQQNPSAAQKDNTAPTPPTIPNPPADDPDKTGKLSVDATAPLEPEQTFEIVFDLTFIHTKERL